MIRALTGTEVKNRVFADAHPSLSFDLNQNIGPKYIATTYSCIPHAVYPWDPEVVRAMWEFDPELRPLWIQDIFLDDGQEVVFGRHGWARKITLPRGVSPISVTMPTMPVNGLRFDAPNYEALRWYDAATKPAEYPGAPGGYLPFDWELVGWLKSHRLEADAKTWKKIFIDDKREARARRKALSVDQHLYRVNDINRYVRRKMNDVSEVEVMEVLRGSTPRGV